MFDTSCSFCKDFTLLIRDVLTFLIISFDMRSVCLCVLRFERVIGIEPTSSAWKADALTVVLYPLIFLSLLAESNCHLGVTNAL